MRAKEVAERITAAITWTLVGSATVILTVLWLLPYFIPDIYKYKEPVETAPADAAPAVVSESPEVDVPVLQASEAQASEEGAPTAGESPPPSPAEPSSDR